jgi:hypothetical protein
VAVPDYFTDRAPGLAVFDKSILDIKQTFDMIVPPWERGGEPMWRHRDLAFHEEARLRAFSLFERDNPRLAAAVVARFQPPAMTGG